MAKNRYLTIEASDQLSPEGKVYPDPILDSLNNFIFLDSVETYIVTQKDIMRIDLLMYEKYRYVYYDDIILDLNGIGHISLLEPGDTIKLPSKRDLDNFFAKNLKKG